MSKTAIDNEEISGNGYLQDEESLFELVGFYAGVVLTLLMPTLLYCYVIKQLWPLWVMVSIEALGAILGFVLFKLPPDDFPSCVPVTRVRKALPHAHASELKKAA